MTDHDGKHGVKQVDRLLSNAKVSPWSRARAWIAMLVGPREEVLVALDWTDFDKDDHTLLVASLITNHGRATPMVWKTVKKSKLAEQRNAHEDELQEHLSKSLPEGFVATIVADRGFGDQKRYPSTVALGMHDVIRFREGIVVTNQWGDRKPDSEWLSLSGRATMLKDMAVTADCYVVPAVVLVHDKQMKDAWCIATSRSDKSAAEIVKWYGKRFTIEETFRDTKNGLLGIGLSSTHIRDEARRDRLIFIAAIAHMLLTLLGAAGERCGLDRTLKSNTSKKRQMSLYLKLDSADPANLENRWRGTSAVPKVVMSVDGCPVTPPPLRGFLNYGGADGRIVFTREQMWRGDLIIVFEAFDQQHTMLLANDDKGLRTVVPEEMKMFIVEPANPATGEPTGLGYMAPDCSNFRPTRGGRQ